MLTTCLKLQTDCKRTSQKGRHQRASAGHDSLRNRTPRHQNGLGCSRRKAVPKTRSDGGREFESPRRIFSIRRRFLRAAVRVSRFGWRKVDRLADRQRPVPRHDLARARRNGQELRLARDAGVRTSASERRRQLRWRALVVARQQAKPARSLDRRRETRRSRPLHRLTGNQ